MTPTDAQREGMEPCPFCGAGTTEIQENGRVWNGRGYGEPSSVSVRHWCDPIEGQPSRMIERVGRDRESAIAAWNRRASPDEPGGQRLSIRLNGAGQVDEVFAQGADLHIEQMNDGHWWMGVTDATGEFWHINFSTNRNTTINCFVESDGVRPVQPQGEASTQGAMLDAEDARSARIHEAQPNGQDESDEHWMLQAAEALEEADTTTRGKALAAALRQRIGDK
jgi:hypothetical protein